MTRSALSSPRFRRLSALRRWGTLLLLLGLCFVVASLGGLVTAQSVGDWYHSLNRPPFTPPDWVFAPVWTTLYVLMAFAAWRAWKRDALRFTSPILWVWLMQLALNLLWSFLFFGFREIAWAAIEILVLWAAIALTIQQFFLRDKLAALLMVPYLLWVSLASALTIEIFRLN